MLLRAVSSEDRSEQQYWQQVRSDPSPVQDRRSRRALTIADIDDQEGLGMLLDPQTYVDSPLRDQLCSLVLTRGSHWSLSVPSTFFSTPAGRALLMWSCVHAATKRMHVRKDTSRRKVIPSFDQLMPAYFWSPLVHRLRDHKVWSRFYRQQHRLNGRTVIESGLARGVSAVVGNKGDRYEHWEIAFVTDAELAGMLGRVEAAQSVEQRMHLLNIHPGDRYMFD